jgi:hypothetical protein
MSSHIGHWQNIVERFRKLFRLFSYFLHQGKIVKINPLQNASQRTSSIKPKKLIIKSEDAQEIVVKGRDSFPSLDLTNQAKKGL